jgi:hypothetical protein
MHMQRTILSVLFLSILLLVDSGSSSLFCRQQQQPALRVETEAAESDPDMPVIAGVTIDKEKYLRARENHIGLLRGLPYPPGENPRIRAVRTEERLMKSVGIRTNAALAAWTFVGPVALANGQTEGGHVPISGRVTAIAIHPTHPETVYVGTAQGGVYRTLNGGASWTAIFDNALSLSIGALAIDPVNPTTLFVGTGEGNLSLDSYFGVGLYIVKNAETSPVLNGPYGLNAASNNILAYRSINRIYVNPSDDNTIFIATTSGGSGLDASPYPNRPPRGIYRSTNAMSSNPVFSWIDLGAGSNPIINDMVFDPADANVLVASVYGQSANSVTGGIFRTANALSSVPAFTKVLAMPDFINMKLCANRVGSFVTMYAATAESIGTIRKSHDGGQTWSNPLPAAYGFCTPQCWYDIAVGIDPNDSMRVYLSGSGAGYGGGSSEFKYSVNGGVTFINSYTNLHADVHALAVAASPHSNKIYLGCDGGIFKSTNSGLTWASVNTTGFTALQFESIALHPSSRNFTIGGTQDNGTPWMKASGLWTRADWGDGGFAAIDQNPTDTINVTMYHTYFNQTSNQVGYARVTSALSASDGGWTFLGNGSNGIGYTDNVLFYAPLTLGPGNPNTVYYGTDRLYRSANRGLNNVVVSQSPINGSAISAIGISRQNDNVRIVGLQDGSIWATTTGSSTLTNITGSTPGYYPARTVIDPNDTNTAYVSYDGYGTIASPLQHVWKTTTLAGAPAWAPASNGLPDVPVNAFAIDPRKSSDLYCGTDIGVYYSSNAGGSWSVFGSGLPRVAVFDIAVQDTFRILRIATHGKGMWEIPTSYQGPASVTINSQAAANWNLLSLPVTPFNDSLPAVYPGAQNSAFFYIPGSGYSPSKRLATGTGYWIWFASAQPTSVTGIALTKDTVNVAIGWNLIGSVGKRVVVSTIQSQPAAIVTSNFFGYTGAYIRSDTLQPGLGYWVNVSQAGKLILTGGPAADFAADARIRIEPTNELPPAPPTREPSGAGELPSAFRLEQNYPNPFNPTTVIRYELPGNAGRSTTSTYNVSLRVYNMVGQRVATLVEGVQDAGYKRIEFDASRFVSGVYFYHLDATGVADPANTFKQVKKMILMK